MADAFSFIGAVELLRNLGMFDIILPVLLVYAVVFGILQRAAIFERGKGDKKEANKELNAAIALVIALLFVSAANLTGLIQKFLPFVGLISVLMITFLMLISMIGGNFSEILDPEKNKWASQVKVALLILSSIAFMFTFGLAAGWWNMNTAAGFVLSQNGIFTTENVSVLIFLAVLIIIIMWVTQSSETKKEKKPGS